MPPSGKCPCSSQLPSTTETSTSENTDREELVMRGRQAEADMLADHSLLDHCKRVPQDDSCAFIAATMSCITAKCAARHCCPASDLIGHITPRHLLLVPILDMQSQRTTDAGLGCKVVAVIKLLNRVGSHDGSFSFVDENLVQAMARQASSALQMAKYASLAQECSSPRGPQRRSMCT